MATQTPNLNLVLPDYSDKADVGVINDNFKKIDNFSGGGKVEEWLGDIQEKADASLAKISQDANTYLQSLQTEATESLREIENKAKNALDSIPDDYETLYNDVGLLKDTKADAIRDTSAKAVAHELHAQSGPMSVTLHGKTTEKGTGDKSPDNPYTINGVNRAKVQAGNKNLFGGKVLADALYEVTANTAIDEDAKKVTFNSSYAGNSTLNSGVEFKPNTQYTLIIKGRNNRSVTASNVCLWYEDGGYAMVYFNDASDVSYGRLVSSIGKTVRGIGTIIYGGITELLYEECGIFEGGVSVEGFEPYNANVIDMPLLPDGDPLMESDTIENDVPSGCDEFFEFNGNGGFEFYETLGTLANVIIKARANFTNGDPCFTNYLKETSASSLGTGFHSSTTYFGRGWIGFKIDGLNSREAYNDYFAANPLKVYYRSTAYTSEKDLRVCRTMRQWETVTLDGSEDEGWDAVRMSINLGKRPMYDYKNQICNWLVPAADYPSAPNRFRINTSGDLFVVMEQTFDDEQAFRDYLAGNPLKVVYQLADTEVYMTDRHELRKPDGLMPVTVTGSGETAVEYPHQTKHYIDSQIAAAVALALNG